MAFEDLTSFVRPGIDLPILGRTYYVPPPNARDGAWLQALMDGSEVFALTQAIGAANKQVLSDEQERTVYQLALGPAYAEMVANDVPWPFLKHAGMTCWVAWTRSRDAAERYWSTLREDGQGNLPAGQTPESSPADGSPAEKSTLSPA